MALASGTRLGPDEVVGLLGAGGMGEVYRARDPRLGRDVAIKVLPADVARGGKPPGARISLRKSGGTMDVDWRVASVTVPMSRVDLVVNGEIRESRAVKPDDDRGRWSVRVERSSWVALLVRGHYADRPEIIAAHSSPVMIEVEATPFFSAADALTILHQIEGALAYLDTVGTRAETAAYQRMRLVLTGAHRSVHNRLHQQGVGHAHTAATDHPEHH